MLSSAPTAPSRTEQDRAPGSRIVVISSSADLSERVHMATGGAFILLSGPLPASPAALFDQLDANAAPDVILLDPGPNAAEQALVLAARMDEQCPGISVIVISEVDPALALHALRAGVRDLLPPAADVPEIRLVLDRASRAARTRRPENGGSRPPTVSPADRTYGRVISVVSPKGGVGKTTVATNLAVGLAKTAPHSTVLVDLDIQFGDVASALSLEPEYCLPDAVHGPASQDTLVLKTYLSVHSTGLYVLCGPQTPAAADTISAEAVSALIQSLATEFRYVVLDTAPGLSDHTLAAMDRSTDLILLTSMDVPGVRGLRKELDTLRQLGMLPPDRHVVLNLAERRGGLSLDDVAATLGTGIDLVLARSAVVTTSINQGVPLLQNGVRDPITKKLTELVQRFAPPPPRKADRRRGRHQRRRGR